MIYLSNNKTKSVLCLLLILLLGYSIRLVTAANATISRDGIYYVRVAEEWSATQRLRNDYEDTVLFICIIKELIEFHADHIKACLGLNIVLGIIILIEINQLIRKYTKNDLVALTVTFIAAIHPTLIRYSTDILRENLFLVLALYATKCIMGKDNKPFILRTKNILKVMIATVLAALSRTEGVFLLLFFFIESFLFTKKKCYVIIESVVFVICFLGLYILLAKLIDKNHTISLTKRFMELSNSIFNDR